jgi:predicted ATPase/DNA-binding CsgD family transcriptional regulator/DNA-binding XRE family transcriptional regulator
MGTHERSSFGQLLRRHRLAAGLTQEELAERTGLSARAITDLERGVRRFPYPDTVARLADGLGLGERERDELRATARRVHDAAPAQDRSEHDDRHQTGVVRKSAEGVLPLQLTSFVGRQHEVAEIRALLQQRRLVTLVGAGGVGKTRLALQVAAEAVAGYPDGVWMVDLAPIAEAALVPKAVASVLDVREQPDRPLAETLIDALRQEHLLLLLDNCEHLVQPAAVLVQSLLQGCPGLCVLATSRHALRAPGETVWWVPSLSLPEPDASAIAEHVARSEAAQLFVERARAVRPEFGVTNENAASVAEVCRKLDGIPLALELAAARVLVLSAEQIAARLDDRFKLLTGGSPTALPRQQTLRGTLDWSYELLSAPEQMLLRRLAVFAGGWILEAAESVCAGEGLESDAVLDLLQELVSKSLVLVWHEAHVVRYRLLETVRQYAWERLREADEQEDTYRRHRDWCLRLAEEAEPRLYGAEQVEWLHRLEREHDNVRAALTWNQAPSGEDSIAFARMARALWWFWYLHGHFSEGYRWTKKAASSIEPSSLQAGVLLGAGWLRYGRGELERAASLLDESLTLAGDYRDGRTVIKAMIALAFTLRDRGEDHRSGPLLDECLALARDIGDRWSEGFALYLMGVQAANRRDRAAVADLCGRSISMFRESGERLGLAYASMELGRLAFDDGHADRALQLFGQGLTLSRELGNRRGICFALEGLAQVARSRGELEEAVALLQEAVLIWQQLGNQRNQTFPLAGLAVLAAEHHDSQRAAWLFAAAEARQEPRALPESARAPVGYQAAVSMVREDLGDAAFDLAWAAGRAMKIDEVIEQALAVSATRAQTSVAMTRTQSADPAVNLLSAREREIAVLVAQGLSNRRIAETLVIASRTAGTHVGHILDKLGLHSRAQIAAWSVEHGLDTAPTE